MRIAFAFCVLKMTNAPDAARAALARDMIAPNLFGKLKIKKGTPCLLIVSKKTCFYLSGALAEAGSGFVDVDTEGAAATTVSETDVDEEEEDGKKKEVEEDEIDDEGFDS